MIHPKAGRRRTTPVAAGARSACGPARTRHRAHACRRAGAGLLGLALGLVASVRVAGAGDVPSTARAQSLRIDPLLLDSPALAFQFPQLVASGDSAALAFGRTAPRSELFVATNGNEYGLGATSRRETFGGFVYSQYSYLPDRFSGTSITYQYNTSNVLQIGAGARVRPVRFGAAVRGTRSQRGNQQKYSLLDENVLQSEIEHLEVAAGVGIAGRGVTLDAVFEWGHTKYTAAQSYRSRSDTVVTQLTGEPQQEGRFAVRLAVPAGSRLRIIAAGRSSWGETRWSGQDFRNQQLYPIDRTDRSKIWFTGLSALLAAPHLDCLGVTATFEHRDQTIVGVNSNQGLSLATRMLDYATLTISAQRRLWEELLGQVGFTTAYRRDRVDSSTGHVTVVDLRATREETITDGFSWGLSYTWRGMEFAGSMQVPPRLDDPIGTLDLYLEF